jgi:DNA-binding Lrp family transcriptional regulator
MSRLDETDMKILTALCADASVSVPKLSKDLGVNLSVTYSRIKRLQKKGVIGRFTIDVDEAALGLPAGALVGLNLDPKLREPAMAEVERSEGVRMVWQVTGRFDLMVALRGGSLDEVHRTVHDVMGKIPGVLHAELFMEVSKRVPPVRFRLPGR